MFNTWEAAQNIKNTVIQFRRELHEIPELGFELQKTINKIKMHLEEMGIKANQCGKAGLVALIEAEKTNGPVIGIRADMDALPIQEDTGLDFASKHQGIMHACGHDAHMAILLGVAKLLNENRGVWKGRVKLIFQPAEEIVSGAIDMVTNGVLENPKLDSMFGLHVWQPLASGKVGIKNGPFMASSDNFKITIHGKSAHGAMPHEGVDAIASAAEFIHGIQHLLTRVIPSNEKYVLSFGKIAGGIKENAIADKVIIEGTFRTFSTEVRNLIEKKIKDFLESKVLTNGIQYDYALQFSCPPTINHNALAVSSKASIIKAIGENNAMEYGPVMPAEDFSEYCSRVPSVFFFVGGGNENYIYPHHHPKFDIDEEVLPIGVASLLQMILDLTLE